MALKGDMASLKGIENADVRAIGRPNPDAVAWMQRDGKPLTGAPADERHEKEGSCQ